MTTTLTMLKFRIAKPGKSVYSPSPKDFRAHEKYPLLKLAKQGKKGELTDDNGMYQSYRIRHGLGYNPISLFYTNMGTIDKPKMQLALGYQEAFPYVSNPLDDLDNLYLHMLEVGKDFYFMIFYDRFF